MSATNLIKFLKDALVYGVDFNLSAGQVMKVRPSTDDQGSIQVGDGTDSMDVSIYGNSVSSSLAWDASKNLLIQNGPSRLQGFNSIGPRFELRWQVGENGGKPAARTDGPGGNNYADAHFEFLTVGGTITLGDGGVTLNSGTAAGNYMLIQPNQTAGYTIWKETTWNTSDETHWECFIRTGASIDPYIAWAGLRQTTLEENSWDDDNVHFLYEDNVGGGKWQVAYSIAGVDTATNTSVVVAANTAYHLKIEIQADRTAKCYVNGNLEVTTSALTASETLTPMIAVKTDILAGTVRTLKVYGQAASKLVT